MKGIWIDRQGGDYGLRTNGAGTFTENKRGKPIVRHLRKNIGAFTS